MYILNSSIISHATEIDPQNLWQKAISLKTIEAPSMIILLEELMNSLKKSNPEISESQKIIQHLTSLFETNTENRHQHLLFKITKDRPLNNSEEVRMISISIYNLYILFSKTLEQYSKEHQEVSYKTLQSLSDAIKTLLVLLINKDIY